MTDTPAWLNVMRSALGTKEYAGDADNPAIIAMRDEVKRIWGDVPGLTAYADTWQHDVTPWCGLAGAWAVSEAGYMPPFKKGSDTDSFYWAQSWASDDNFIELDEPRLGAITVLTRSGGGHISFYERTEGSNVILTGGNQGDAVTTAPFAKSSVIGYFWPKDAPLPPAERRELQRGDTGADVAEVQRILGLPDDGEFGSITESGVKQYQGARGLSKDGVVGPQTWAKLDELDGKMSDGKDGISDELAAQIDQLCARSPVNSYSWPDRGKAPVGYYAGMAKTYALAVKRLDMSDEAAVIMAQASTGNTDKDALAWYAEEFEDAEIDINDDGIGTLRALFVMMVGLGMRESSGNHWCGRDMSASNVQSDTAEAGLFQTSWNIRSCNSAIPPLLAEYWDDPNGFRPTFDRGVSPTASNLDAYGSGDGARYQFLAKYSPAFHALVTGVGMRRLRQHWGPINRREVDLVGAVDDLLIEVDALMAASPPEPEPVPEPATVALQITASGSVTVTVNGTPIGEF